MEYSHFNKKLKEREYKMKKNTNFNWKKSEEVETYGSEAQGVDDIDNNLLLTFSYKNSRKRSIWIEFKG